MVHLIDKDALVTKIKRLKEENKPNSKSISEYIKGGIYGFDLAIEKTLSAIDALDAKEVDLQEEINNEWEKCNPIDEGMGVESAFIHIEAFDMIARHFFELGFKAKG